MGRTYLTDFGLPCSEIKSWLNEDVAEVMTLEHVKERNSLGEIEKWFKAILNICQK